MELKFKEVGEDFKESEIKGLKIKQYLTIDELNQIVDSCLATENQVERHWIKVVMVSRFCTNIELEDGDITKEEYDLIVSNNLLYEIESNVDNYYAIDKCVKETEGFYTIGKMFINSLNDRLKDFDMNKIQEGFTGLKEVIK